MEGLPDYMILINNVKTGWSGELSYDEIVRIAYGDVPTNPDKLYTITYGRGPETNREGSVRKGETVAVTDGMIFCVADTSRA